MLRHVMALDISSGPFYLSVMVLGSVFLVVLFLRPSNRWTITAVAALLAGALLGFLTVWLVEDVFDVFRIGFTAGTWFWVIVIFAALALAVTSFRHSARWRQLVAAMSIPVFLLVAVLGINAEFGLNKTLGSLLGISTEATIELAKPAHPASTAPAGPLYSRWKAPADMPATGKTGTQPIAGITSGFTARDAAIYLPPAAQTANPPQLPVVVMLMGQPGAPTTEFVAPILDKYAAEHGGLAPIVVVADQIGPDQNDTLCLNTAKFGNVESYVNTDVVNWVKSNLNVLPDRKFWTIAGYSNGGQCSISFGAKHPEIWGNILDISGEEFPGAEQPAENLADIFGSDQAAYDAQKPINIMAKALYRDTTAIFTVGSDDTEYVSQAKTVEAAAKAAGMNTTYFEVLNGGHVIGALNGGLEKGFEILYPRLGLAP